MITNALYKHFSKKYGDSIGDSSINSCVKYGYNTSISKLEIVLGMFLLAISCISLPPAIIYHSVVSFTLFITSFSVVAFNAINIFIVKRYREINYTLDVRFERVNSASNFTELIELSKNRSIHLKFYDVESINDFIKSFAKYHETTPQRVFDRHTGGLSSTVDMLFYYQKFNDHILVLDHASLISRSTDYSPDYIVDMRKYGTYIVDLI